MSNRTLKENLKAIWYAKFIDYHLGKARKLMERRTASDYHFDLAQYYFKKAYGRDANNKK